MGGPPLSKPPPVVSCVRSLQVDLASGDERAMHGEVLEFAGLGEPVQLAQFAESDAESERFEDLLCRASIDQDDHGRRTEAEVALQHGIKSLRDNVAVAAL